MLPKENRLRRSADFRIVKQTGKRLRQGPLTVNFAPNHLALTRVGFVIPKRVGTAVVRNRVKRRLRAISHNHIESVRAGFDIVLIAYPSVDDVSFSKLDSVVVKLLVKAGVLEDQP